MEVTRQQKYNLISSFAKILEGNNEEERECFQIKINGNDCGSSVEFNPELQNKIIWTITINGTEFKFIVSRIYEKQSTFKLNNQMVSVLVVKESIMTHPKLEQYNRIEINNFEKIVDKFLKLCSFDISNIC